MILWKISLSKNLSRTRAENVAKAPSRLVQSKGYALSHRREEHITPKALAGWPSKGDQQAMFECDFSSGICKDEWCTIEGIHAPHPVRQHKEKQPRSVREPWLLTSVVALDESIERAVCKLNVGSFGTIVNEVENDFGSLGPTEESGIRRVHRRLAELVRAGRVLRIDVGGRLFAYLRPKSRIADDLDFLRESIKSLMDFDVDYHTKARWSAKPDDLVEAMV